MSVKISRLLAAVMLFAAFIQIPSYAAEDYYTAEMIEEYNYQSELLSALGIYGGIIPDVSQEVSRAEFAAVISKFKGFSAKASKSDGKSRFSDVETDDANYAYIVNAAELGLMTANGNRFYPKSTVSSNDVLGALVKMLGYDMIYKNTNILVVADSAGLTDGIAAYLGVPVTYGVLSAILTNALDAGCIDNMSENNVYKKSEKTILEEWFDVTEAEGIMTAAAPTDLLRKGTVKEKLVRIDDIAYGTEKNYADYLGMCVKYYYKEDGSLIFARPKKNGNAEKVIYSENIDDFGSREYTYSADGTGASRRAKIDYDCCIVYNGSPVSETDRKTLIPTDGYIRLIDNDGDGRADVLFIMDYKIIDINSTDKDEYIIYDKNTLENKLELKNAYENGTLYISDSSGYALEFGELSAGDVIIAYASKDGETAKLVVLSSTVSGMTDAYSQSSDDISIDGKAYKTAAGFNWKDAGISLSGKFYLDERQRAAYFRERTDPKIQLGYMITCNYDTAEEMLYIRALNSSGDIVNLMPAKTISVDNTAYKDYNKAYGKISASVSISRLVRYELNESGEVKKLYTAGGTNEEDGFRLSFPKASRQYISAQRSFYGSFSLTGDTLIFRIPNDDTGNYDAYGVFNRGYLQNAEYYDVEAYNYGEGDLIPNAVVIYEAADKTNSIYGIVNDCGTVLNSDDEVKSYISVVSQWSTATYYTDDASVIAAVGKGDFVRCAYGTKNTVYSVECIYDYSEEKYLKSSNPTNSFAIGKRIAFGQVYERSGTVIGISYDEITAGTNRTDIEVCDTALFQMYKMDESLIHPVPVKASAEDIKDYKHFGSECSRVLIVTDGENPTMIAIY